MATLAVPVARAPLDVAPTVPASKSLHQRALVLAVLGDRGGTTRLEAEGAVSDDVAGLARALTALCGLPISPRGDVPGAVGPDGALGGSRERVRCDLGMNATGLRLLTAVAGLRPVGARTLLTGRPRLRARPHDVLLRALGRLGAHAHRRPTGALRVLGRRWTRHDVAVPAARSSQPVSALLLAAVRAGGLALRLVGDPVSRGYVGLTAQALATFGLALEVDGDTLRVAAGSPRAARFVVEPDASSAAVWWAAAALVGGRARVPGLARTSAQPDVALLDVLVRMGGRVTVGSDGIPVVEGRAGGALVGAGDVDLRDSPDLAPLVAALAAGADGVTRVVGAPHLADKESDRIASAVAAVRAVGGDAAPAPDGFVVRGRALAPGVVRVGGDHRIALAFGVLGLAHPGVVLDGIQAVSKSYPDFPAALLAAAADARIAASIPAPPGPPP